MRWWMLMAALAACDDEARPCEPDEARPTCAPLYAATFAELHTRRLGPTCSAGTSCHSAGSAQGGLVLEDAASAYDGLVVQGRVEAGAPACSLLMERLDAGDMPPGAPLTEAERCAFRLWIFDGARR